MPENNKMLLPKNFFRTPDGKLGIVWNDDSRVAFGLKELRCACPCAACVDEHTGEKLLDSATVPEDIKLETIVSIGRYAIGCVWSDGHRSGIYPYSYIKGLTNRK